MNYYNEFDPHAAAWLRELIRQNLIPRGDVDTRSITDVHPNDLKSYTQCHFFAGIGGWSLALQLANWPEDRPVWTGSCPCQPFSNAGKRLGTADERHLWPVFRDLIAECRPPKVLGEQVASKAGRSWLSSVHTDLEALAYGVGSADLCAAGVGAPHIRQRLYWVAHALRVGQPGQRQLGQPGHPTSGEDREKHRVVDAGGGCGLVDSASKGLERSPRAGVQGGGPRLAFDDPPDRHHTTSTFDPRWSTPDWLFCRDGKWRPVEPGTSPLAHGVSARVVRLRGYGNAIVPEVAKIFIEAYDDLTDFL